MKNRRNNPSVRVSLLSVKNSFPRFENRDKSSAEPCHICGDIGVGEFITTCSNCREVREHTYCAKIRLQSPPDMWLCQMCRSSNRVLQISNLVHKDIKAASATDYGASISKISSKFSEERSSYTSPSKKHKPQFVAFPSQKRKRRTLRVPVVDTEETSRSRTRKLVPLCVSSD